MLKNFTHIGLALALVLPPWPLPHLPVVKPSLQFPTIATMPLFDGQVVKPSIPLIFSDTLNGLNVRTTITKIAHAVIQDVQMTGTKESIHFQLTLLPNDPILHSQQSRQIATQDEFIFSQAVKDKTILTKELIKTEKPNTKDGSTYKWRFSSDSNITLDMLMNGTIAQIQPFVYWTKQGQEKIAQVRVEGSSLLVLKIQEPEESYPLMIDPSIAYGQWLGAGTTDMSVVLAIAVELGSGEIYVGGYANGPFSNAATLVGTYTNSDGFVAEMTGGNPPSINWMHYLGGNSLNYVLALAVNGDEIYAGGYTSGTISWETAGSTAGTFTDANTEGFVVEIADGSPPILAWRLWLGGHGGENINALAVTGDEIYAGGITTSLSSWETADSIIGTHDGSGIHEGFVVEIADGSPPTLPWLMWIGGVNYDYIYTLAVNGDEIYAGGNSNSSDSWDTAVSTVGTFTDAVNNEGFVVEIADGSPPVLDWRMWVGAVGSDELKALAVNGDEIYAGGHSSSSASWETVGSTAGTFTDNGVQEGFVAEIADGGPPNIAWRMWLGGTGNDYVYALAVNGDEIYAGGGGDSSDSWDTAGSTKGTFTDPFAAEGFVVEIADAGPPTIAWRAWVGATGYDQIIGLAVNGEAVFAAGYINSYRLSMETFTTVSGTVIPFAPGYSNDYSGYVMEIDDGSPPTYFWLQWLTGTGVSQINALAVNADEIYAGGYSAPVSLGTVTDVGTPNSNAMGFVVEIADGATPSLNWRMWLGGTSTDQQVLALAVNGDEVYASGYSYASSTSWVTAASTAGTLNQSGQRDEAFVVEIADGSPPTLAWRYWIGGNQYDRVYALAVNGDEIYATGYSSGSVSWDTVASTAGTYTAGFETFVVEIADGGPPSLAWRLWLGGTSTDQGTSLAINGDEIYVGGYSNGTVSWDTVGSTAGTFNGTGGYYVGFVTEITDGGPPTAAWNMWVSGVRHTYVRALAINADEIYAGGESVSSASWVTAGSVVGTFTDTNATYEGYVVEIADGGPPTLSWLMWLGGVGNDYVYALAVNGDEIYAAGYSVSFASWDTAGSTKGTFTDSGLAEGFIVEVSDGGPPSLNWRIWEGSESTDYTGSLVVNGDEIYSGGYGSRTKDMEGTFSGTKYDGMNSGFVVEISDAEAAAATVNAIFFGTGF